MNILIILLFLSLMFFINLINKEFFNPFNIFINFWALQILICISLFSSTTKWAYNGIIYIYILCSFLIFILLLFKTKNKNKLSTSLEENKEQQEVDYEINNKIAVVLLLLFISIGFSYSILIIYKYGFNIKNLFNINDLLLMNSSVSYRRYFNGVTVRMIDKVLLAFAYLSPMCSGYLMAFNKKKIYKVLAVMSFLPELTIFMTENTKAPLVACIIFFLISWLVGYIVKNNKPPVIHKKQIIKLSLFGIFIFALLFLSMMFRNGKINQTTYNIVSMKIRNYIFGHIPAFDNWFNFSNVIFPNNLGEQTFIGIFDLIGISSRSQGIYTDSYAGGALGSNVYTYFRGVLTDFGIIGSFIFISLILLIAAKIYYNLINGNSKPIYQFLFVSLVSFILFCFVSIFSYNSFTLAFIIYYLFIYIIKRRKI